MIIVSALSIVEIFESFQEEEAFQKSSHLTELILILNLSMLFYRCVISPCLPVGTV